MGSEPERKASVGIAYQIPRNTLALLMVAQIVVVVPYLLQLSPWIISVGLFCGLWRTKVYQGRWDYPHRWVKALLVFASVAGVVISGVGAFSLEAAASLLIVAFALKLIEMKSRRDAYLVIFLSYFIIATQFLFDQSIVVAIYQVGALIVVTAALVGLHQLHTQVRPLVSLKLASVLVLQALPLTMVLFLFFPRVAPLWTVPLPGSGTTGISDQVTPGDFASLAQSDELAFRVVIDGRIPPPSQLYWRGLVYSDYEAGTWRAAERRRAPIADRAQDLDGLGYEVLLEPTMRTWLYVLKNSTSLDPGVYRTVDNRLEARDPVMSVFRYRAWANDLPSALQTLSETSYLRETALDEEANPRIRSLAASLRESYAEDVELVKAVLDSIRREPYHYTLSPPLYQSRNSIDDFWFDGQAGFCTHYAGAFVYLMRAAGIPARMVGGYQGGELNPITGHLIVRQYDAHGWAEVWLAERGWVRVDPTAAVAPERVEQGLRAALSSADLASLSLFTNARMGKWDLLGDVLRWADSIEHRWNLWVVGYDTNFQTRFLEDLLGELTPTRIGLAILGGGMLTLGGVAVVLFWRRREVHRHPVEKAFRGFCEKLDGYGYRRRPEESPSSFVRRIAAEVGLTDAQVGGLIAELDTLLYNPSVAWGARELQALRSQLRRLQFRLAFSTSR